MGTRHQALDCQNLQRIRNGGRHCCQPPLRRAKDLPVFVTWLIESFRPTYPLSILAHQLRRRFRSCNSLFRGAWLIYSTTWPEGSLVVRSARPGRNRDSGQNRPMFRGPSWEILYRVPLRSPSPRGGREPRRATGRSLFRRLFPAGPDKNPKVLTIACRRRSDLWSPAAPFLPFPALRGGRDRRPDHLVTMHISAESRKQNFRQQACG